jgi:immunity protein Imm1 of predicted polymorphic toxin system
MYLRWNAGPGADVTDAAQLERVLDALLSGPAAAGPLIAHLAGEAGALGLGLDPAGGGLLLFAPADRSRPALHSVGHASHGDDDLVFSVGGQRYEFSARCRVPAQTVRAAAGEYLATGELPLGVTWEPEPSAQPG